MNLHRALLNGDTIVDDRRYMVNTWAPDAVAG